MGIGLANQPPSAQAQISQIARRTEKAGTARFTISTRTTSSTPGAGSTSIESGEISFKTDSISFTVHYPALKDGSATAGLPPTLRIIGVGRILYVYQPNLPSLGSVGATTGPVGSFWGKDSLSTAAHERTDIFSTFGPMGLVQIPSSTQVPQIEDLGNRTVGDETTTEYQYGVSTCQSTSNGATQYLLSTPTTLWVDSHDRLVEGETAETVVVRNPKQSGTHTDRLTTSETVRLYDFGKPVNITAPMNATAGTEIGFATDRCIG